MLMHARDATWQYNTLLECVVQNQSSGVWSEVVKAVGYEMLRREHMEDKFVGCMLLQDFIRSAQTISTQTELKNVEMLFDDELVYGWAVTDTLCGRVLAELIQRQTDHVRPALRSCSSHMLAVMHILHNTRDIWSFIWMSGTQNAPENESLCVNFPIWPCLLTAMPAADSECKSQLQAAVWDMTAWCHAQNTWKCRASVVSMVTFAGKDPLYVGFRAHLLDTAAVTVQRPDRFVQLGTGLLLTFSVVIAHFV
jgi:hypothetical protein